MKGESRMTQGQRIVAKISKQEAKEKHRDALAERDKLRLERARREGEAPSQRRSQEH
jgi:hypothetical protein